MYFHPEKFWMQTEKVLKFWDLMLEISIIFKIKQNFRNQKFEENCAANSIKLNQIRWKQTPSFFISCSKIHVISCQNKNVKHPLMEEVFSLLVALRLAEVRIRQKSVSERRSRGARSSPQPSEIFFLLRAGRQRVRYPSSFTQRCDFEESK